MEGLKGEGGREKNNRLRSLSPPSTVRASSFQSRHSWAIICLSLDLICHFNYLSVCVSFCECVCVSVARKRGREELCLSGYRKKQREQKGMSGKKKEAGTALAAAFVLLFLKKKTFLSFNPILFHYYYYH